MITIIFNGESQAIEGEQPLSRLLDALPDLPDNFAVAVNEAFVPRSAYADTHIREGDQVEMLVPMQGG